MIYLLSKSELSNANIEVNIQVLLLMKASKIILITF